MNYTIDKSVFALNPSIKFGILIGYNLKNSRTTVEDEQRLRLAENTMREQFKTEGVRELANVVLYRDILSKAGINPNKFPASVEAMFKRILKGSQLPLINAIVDLCNSISIERVISLGAHDLIDIQDDLEVRFSRYGDIFLPFGAEKYENVEEGELVFTSGNKVQTRKWVWRQSELGKITINSNRVFFQIVGFDDSIDSPLYKAMNDIESIIINRFKGTCEKYIVDVKNPSISF